MFAYSLLQTVGIHDGFHATFGTKLNYIIVSGKRSNCIRICVNWSFSNSSVAFLLESKVNLERYRYK